MLILVAPTALAEPARVLLLASKDSSVYQEVIRVIRQQLADADIQLAAVMDPNSTSEKIFEQFDLIVPIGTLATQTALETTVTKPILSTLIPLHTFGLLSSPFTTAIRQGRITALYLEQPLDRQLQLLKLLQPQVQSLGTVISDNSKQHLSDLQKAATAQGWSINAKELQEDDNPVATLTPIIVNSDAFIALPDRAVFNRSTAKWILLMTFRQQIPLIAFSRSYVEAGALAAIYSTPESVGLETADWIQHWQQNAALKLPPPGYPQRFHLSVNRGTANSLGITPPTDAELMKRLSK